MRFDPGDQLILARATGIDVLHHLRGQVLRLDGRTDRATVVGGGVAAAIGGVVFEQVGVCLVIKAGVALQHFAVLELRAILQNGVPVVGGLVVELLGRQLHVLGGVEAEAVDAIGDGGLQEGLHTVGHGLVLRIQIPQTEQVALRDVTTGAVIDVVAVGTIAVGAGMEIVLVLPIGIDGAPVGGEMVGHHVDDHTHTVLVGGVGHLFEIVFSADHKVADAGVRRLVHVIPVLVELLAIGRNILDLAHRLGLHGSVAGLGDGFHVRRDVLERPHPCVQDGAVLHMLGQTVLLTGRFECGVLHSVRIAVSVGGSGSGGGHKPHTAERRGKRNRTCRQLLPDHSLPEW